MKAFVFICGLPSSGNRMIQSYIGRCGGTAHVVMGYEAQHISVLLDRYKPEDPRMVIPTREWDPWLKSCRKRWPEFPARPFSFGTDDPEEYAKRAIEAVMAYDTIPKYPVRYEDFVADPTFEGKMLCSWLGLEHRPWPKVAPKGRPWDGPIYDANRKYSEVLAN